MADRLNIPRAFWEMIRTLGVEPISVLRSARLSLALCSNENSLVTTDQFFSIWRAIGEHTSDPGLGLKLASQVDPSRLHPAMLAAYYARDYRDALRRHAQFKQLCATGELSIKERGGECFVELDWKRGKGDESPLLVDMTFALLLELGRRGTRHPINPKRVELKRDPERTGLHREYFKCPVKFRAAHHQLVFESADLDRPFVTYNAELLAMLQPQLEKELEHQKAIASVAEQVKWIAKRMLPSGRPRTSAIAKELGLSVRTLHRRMVEEGTTFRGILLEARQELGREYLSQPGMQINEVAFLLGYGDVNSFYRAFRSWEGITPAVWRSESADSENRRSLSHRIH